MIPFKGELRDVLWELQRIGYDVHVGVSTEDPQRKIYWWSFKGKAFDRYWSSSPEPQIYAALRHLVTLHVNEGDQPCASHNLSSWRQLSLPFG
jgi:hypothetical protein